MTRNKMKLSGISTLVADGDRNAVLLLQQMLRGIGMDQMVFVDTAAAVLAEIGRQNFDLCLLEASLPDMQTADLIREIRSRPPPVKFVPILVITSYTHMRNVTKARDAGANMTIKKPISPQVLFDRIAWVASSSRAFVEGGFYAGPDRRHKFIGPPSGDGRRETDVTAEIGEATEPNMSQAEIDALMKPTKVLPI